MWSRLSSAHSSPAPSETARAATGRYRKLTDRDALVSFPRASRAVSKMRVLRAERGGRIRSVIVACPDAVEPGLKPSIVRPARTSTVYDTGVAVSRSVTVIRKTYVRTRCRRLRAVAVKFSIAGGSASKSTTPCQFVL